MGPKIQKSILGLKYQSQDPKSIRGSKNQSWDSNINPKIQKRLPGTHYGSIHLLDVVNIISTNSVNSIFSAFFRGVGLHSLVPLGSGFQSFLRKGCFLTIDGGLVGNVYMTYGVSQILDHRTQYGMALGDDHGCSPHWVLLSGI
jgi:hypothetical protein